MNMDLYPFLPKQRRKWISRARLINQLLPKTDCLLEMGSADGYLMGVYKRKAKTAIAVDIVLSELKVFAVKGVKRVNADATKLPFKDNAFGSIVCSETIEHIKDHKTTLKEIARALKPKGTLVLTAPNRKRLNLTLMRLIGAKPRLHPDHKREYTIKELKELIRGAGLKINKISGNGLLYFGWPGRLFPGLATSIVIRAKKE